MLDQLAACPDTPARMKLFREKVFTSFSAIEQKWLVRIILRDMKLGLRHESVLKWVHEEVGACNLKVFLESYFLSSFCMNTLKIKKHILYACLVAT